MTVSTPHAVIVDAVACENSNAKYGWQLWKGEPFWSRWKRSTLSDLPLPDRFTPRRFTVRLSTSAEAGHKRQRAIVSCDRQKLMAMPRRAAAHPRSCSRLSASTSLVANRRASARPVRAAALRAVALDVAKTISLQRARPRRVGVAIERHSHGATSGQTEA